MINGLGGLQLCGHICVVSDNISVPRVMLGGLKAPVVPKALESFLIDFFLVEGLFRAYGLF